MEVLGNVIQLVRRVILLQPIVLLVIRSVLLALIHSINALKFRIAT